MNQKNWVKVQNTPLPKLIDVHLVAGIMEETRKEKTSEVEIKNKKTRDNLI